MSTMRRSRVLYGIIVLIVLCAGAIALWLVLPVSVRTNEMIAREQVAGCARSVGEEKKELCYEKSLPELMDRGLSLERTFTVLERILVLDRGYQSCHVAAHLLSEHEVAKDPSKWKDVIVRVPVNICGSGAVHGAFQQRFRTEALPNASVAELASMMDGVCDPRDGWNPTFMDRSSCMHGMGHLFLYVTGANVKKSVALCSTIANRPDYDFRQTCTEAVFMQVYQPLEPEDETLIHDIKAASLKPKTFCAQFTGFAHNACVKESWPADPDTARVPAKFEALCKQLPARADANYCANGLMYPVIELLHYDIPTIESFCRALTDSDMRTICWARTASKFVWANWSESARAASICNDAPQESKDSCWKELRNFAEHGMPKDSPEAHSLCAAMPEAYATECLQNTMSGV